MFTVLTLQVSVKKMGCLNEKQYKNKLSRFYVSLIFHFPSLKDSSVNCENTVKSNSEGLTNGNTAIESKFPFLFPAVPRIIF